mgnify:FL=1
MLVTNLTKGKIMGYHKNIDAEQQDKVDRIVRWYKEHDHILPPYIMKRILADGDLVDVLVEQWEKIPVPVSRHVALQAERRKPKADWSMTSQEGKTFFIVSVTTVLLILALLVVSAAL